MRRRRGRMRKRRAAIKTLCSVLGSVALGCAVWLALILAFLFDPYEPPGPPKIVEAHGMSYTLEEWQQLQEEKAAYEAEEFPDSIEEVISQDGQFTSYWDGRYDEAAPDEECWEALRMIQVDKWDESQGATYFRSSSDESTWHSRNLQELFTHGNHTFYKEADK